MINDNQTPFLTPDEIGPRSPLTSAMLRAISAAFDLHALHNVSDLGGTYKLNALLHTSTGIYVIRAYRPWLTPERLKSAQHIQALLFHQSLPIPQPP